MNTLELVLGPWRFEFVPDGDDPGVGTVTWESSIRPHDVPVVTAVDAVTRTEWDQFVRGATL